MRLSCCSKNLGHGLGNAPLANSSSSAEAVGIFIISCTVSSRCINSVSSNVRDMRVIKNRGTWSSNTFFCRTTLLMAR
ncbi:unknown [Acetobacter sp. CAG:267]|nr:unknown [Acetobacter sp. CAG:267]